MRHRRIALASVWASSEVSLFRDGAGSYVVATDNYTPPPVYTVLGLRSEGQETPIALIIAPPPPPDRILNLREGSGCVDLL